MTRQTIGFILTAVLVLMLATPSQAGVLSNFFSHMDDAINNYNENMTQTGLNIIKGFKNKNFNEAVAGYNDGMKKTGLQGIADSKILVGDLKDMVLWIPRQLKKLWGNFVDWLATVRNKILNKPTDTPAADEQPADIADADEAPADEPSADEAMIWNQRKLINHL